MKTIITFETEEDYEVEILLSRNRAHSAICDFKTYLRSIWKYGDLETDAEQALMDKIYEKYHEEFGDILDIGEG